MSKPGAVCKDVSMCFYLAMVIQTLDVLCMKFKAPLVENLIETTENV